MWNSLILYHWYLIPYSISVSVSVSVSVSLIPFPFPDFGFRVLVLPLLARISSSNVWNAVQWRHYSLTFALIHVKSKTRFSSGKPRNIVGNVCMIQNQCMTLGTFSIFVGNGKPQTAKCHVTTVLRSRLWFAVHVWTAARASSGKWFTARFFATKKLHSLAFKGMN